MSALYALPDHLVVDQLLPNLRDRTLSAEQAADTIRGIPGLVPIAIDPAGGGWVYFADFGTHPYRDWQFIFSVERLAASGALTTCFRTPLEVLDRTDLVAEPLDPRGFVFHISRCGSTLFGKVLARASTASVINQGGPLQRGFWAAACNDWADGAGLAPWAARRFRTLLHLLGRERIPGQRDVFVKFISWNTLYLDFIHDAFPEVPRIFLYRDAVEVVSSVLRETTAVLWAKDRPQARFLTGLPLTEVARLDAVEYLAVCYGRYFEVAAEAAARPWLLNYRQLTPDRLFDIVRRAFSFEPEPTDRERMLEQFKYHSKDDSDRAVFADDSADKQQALTDPQRAIITRYCAARTQALDQAERNLYPQVRDVADLRAVSS